MLHEDIRRACHGIMLGEVPDSKQVKMMIVRMNNVHPGSFMYALTSGNDVVKRCFTMYGLVQNSFT